jgi:guanylate kinase
MLETTETDVKSESQTPHGRLIIFTGPSGVGKGTLLRSLMSRHTELQLSISATTRAPRPGEVDGQHYYFLSQEQFADLVAQGALLESAQFAGNYYGTPRQPVEEKLAAGQNVILEIELEGARQVRQCFPEALSIFVLPPSLEELERRIRDRAQDDEAAIARRMARAVDEMAAAAEFDVQVINSDLATTIDQLEAIVAQAQDPRSQL